MSRKTSTLTFPLLNTLCYCIWMDDIRQRRMMGFFHKNTSQFDNVTSLFKKVTIETFNLNYASSIN